MLILRFGDQMNNVAVTDGDKVEAEVRLGYHVDYTPVSELMEYHKRIDDKEVDRLVQTYFTEYEHDAELEDKTSEAYAKVWNAAKAELALRACLTDKGAKGFTTNFDDLGEFDQIPGLASQRLMAEGYGFGAEGDWKSAALSRTVWFMGQGLPRRIVVLGGLHLALQRGAERHFAGPHVGGQPRYRREPAAVGGAFPRHRYSQDADGPFGLQVEIRGRHHGHDRRFGQPFPLDRQRSGLHPVKPLPKLPVASALWIPRPDFEVGAGAWMLAGGTHHSCFSYDLTAEYWEDYAEIAGIEALFIDKNTTLRDFKLEMRVNEVYYMLNKALC